MFTSFYHLCHYHCLRTGFHPFCWFCEKIVWWMYPMHSSSSNKANIWQRGQSMFYLYCFLYWWDYHVILAQTGARFTNDFLPAIQIRWKLRLALIPLLAIRSQQIFCTCHDSTAVMPCTKFCSDNCIGIEMRAKRNFHQIWIAMEKPLVKRGPEPQTVGNETLFSFLFLCFRKAFAEPRQNDRQFSAYIFKCILLNCILIKISL